MEEKQCQLRTCKKIIYTVRIEDQYHTAKKCYHKNITKQFPLDHCPVACDMQRVINNHATKAELKIAAFCLED